MSNVRHITEAKKGLSVKKKQEVDYCNHAGTILIDEHFRILECEGCGKKIDPFEYLLKIARENDMYWDMRKRYKKEAQEVHARLQELKREEKNTKARIKRLQKQIEVE